VRRGTIQLNLHCERQHTLQDFRINPTALRSYLGQLRAISQEANGGDPTALLGHVLALPGVVAEPGNTSFNADEEWPTVERVLEGALARLQAMRQEEGRTMAEEFLRYREQISAVVRQIRERAPEVVAAYRDRLHERVRKLLTELDI